MVCSLRFSIVVSVEDFDDVDSSESELLSVMIRSLSGFWVL